MKVSKSSNKVRGLVRAWRRNGETVGFVPTMGNLHAGHLSLLERSRRRCRRTVLSIFVNPTQFGPREDFGTYPRTLAADLRRARELGVDCCFTPNTESMYPQGHDTHIQIPSLGSVLEGETRPTHFAGVLLIVLKLLHIVEPDVMVLGQKDAQQAVILEAMIRDLDLPTKVVRGAVIREGNGLAMSSRNAYLTPEQRSAAAALHRGLVKARRAGLAGTVSAAGLKRIVREEVRREPLLKLDYVACVDARTLRPLRKAQGRVLMPAAVFAGNTRLIDNEEFTLRKAL